MRAIRIRAGQGVPVAAVVPPERIGAQSFSRDRLPVRQALETASGIGRGKGAVELLARVKAQDRKFVVTEVMRVMQRHAAESGGVVLQCRAVVALFGQHVELGENAIGCAEVIQASAGGHDADIRHAVDRAA